MRFLRYVHGTSLWRAREIELTGALCVRFTDIYACPATYSGVQVAREYAFARTQIDDGFRDNEPALLFFETWEPPTTRVSTANGADVCCWWTERLGISVVAVVPVNAEREYLPLQWCAVVSSADLHRVLRDGVLPGCEAVTLFMPTREGRARALAAARAAGVSGSAALLTVYARRAPDDIEVDGTAVFMAPVLPVRVVSIERLGEVA